jgi:L-2-hydroxyglutarate oxidase
MMMHSGIYYKPGSLKAKLCREGNRRLVEYGIRYEPCGKVIVATTASELPLMENLYARAIANGVGG